VSRAVRRCAIYVPAANLLAAMGIEPLDVNWARFVLPSVTALIREDLMEQQYALGSPEHLAKEAGFPPRDVGFIFRPSMSGIHLFMWAHGEGRPDPNQILDAERDLRVEPDLGEVEGAASLEAMKAEKRADSAGGGTE
jgi:hypothetical protein